MTYCLMTEDGKIRVEIRCNFANKPETMGELCLGLETGDIKPIRGCGKVSLTKAFAKYNSKELLITDWERTGTNLRNINWIPTESL